MLLNIFESFSIFHWVCFSLIIALIIVGTIILIVKANNPKKVRIDQEFIRTLVGYLGEINNILDVKVDNGRVKFLVEDLEKVSFDDIKKISTAGVFITGNNIKMLFQYDAETIKKAIINEKKGN